ncbi:ABC transporter transmembrane domain-containing protein [Saccharopolyspora gregorii]|uniref:ABC transporter ATP-binding protein n=1 Tax=Saccharopolyspora gregorii TaxID=33914 RepID=A0ABP6RTW8_9PSEU|nr:ABC transporter ATP-binding protein [Saccharopolyspora gregorii]
MDAKERGGTSRARRLVLRRQRVRVLIASLLLMGHQACEALVPLAIGLAVDEAVATGEPRALLWCVCGLVLLFTALTTCYRWFSRLGRAAAIDESHALRVQLAGRSLLGSGTRRRHGELLAIASSDADQVSRAVIWVAGLAGSISALGVSCVVLLGIDVRLGVLLIVTAVVTTLGLNMVSPMLSRRVSGQQDGLAAASALATDLVTGMRVVRGLSAQDGAVARYREVSRRAEAAAIRAGVGRSLQLGATVLAGTLVLAVSVGAAGLLAVEQVITVGSFVAAVGAAQFIAEPLSAAGMYLQIGAAALASGRRVDAVLDEQEDAAGDTGPATGPRVELRLDRGGCTGVVAEGRDVERILEVLRGDPAGARNGLTVTWTGGEPDAVHVEPRQAQLFTGTIAENLALGRDTAGEPRPALVASGAAPFVDAQPDGLDEHVRARGLSLSGGQRQRLALARALHADPDVLVLVDPTTALDSVTEEAVADGLHALRHGDGEPRTTVLITTSPVLLARAERVRFLTADGEVVTGEHRTLLDEHADYYRKVVG